MASAILHIKDCYYFEVPKFLARKKYTELEQFPDVWIQLDPHFQEWQASKYFDIAKVGVGPKGTNWTALGEVGGIPQGDRRISDAINAWKEWQHKDGNHGKPYFVFLDEYANSVEAAKAKAAAENKPYTATPDPRVDWYLRIRENPAALAAWQSMVDYYRPYQVKARNEWEAGAEPSDAKVIDGYNAALSGKVLIPQPFGRLRNLYEADSGFCISKYMVIELMVGLIMFACFAWVAGKIRSGAAPKGKSWNLLEALLVFVKKDIAEKAIDHHYAHKFLPFLWTVFFFVLGCNLMGMLPWLGSPTASFGATIALALCTLTVTVVFAGMKKWGFVGFFKNIVPTIDLPGYLFPLKVLILVGLFFIELGGLLIKHGVLAIRLVANMAAGHLVLVSLLFLAFSAEAALSMSHTSWGVTSAAVVVGVSLLSLLELFVAFLQAYVFTFLSALFIDSVLHHH